MSHFSRVRTIIRDLDHLKQALDDLHYRYETGQVTVRKFDGDAETVDLAVRTGTQYDIGYKQVNDVYECIADWWVVSLSTHIQEEQFQNQVAQRYSYHKAIDELEQHGLYVSEEAVTEENVIELVVQWY